jgi:hypothetical protein
MTQRLEPLKEYFVVTLETTSDQRQWPARMAILKTQFTSPNPAPVALRYYR